MHKRKSYNVADELPLKGLGPSAEAKEAEEDAQKFQEVRATDKVELKREVTLINGIGIIVGSIIGSGIFLTPSDVYNYAQDPYGALGVWAGCGIFSLIGAICFAELGTCVTRSGGDYAYIMEAFGPLPAFLCLWVTVLVVRPTTAAIVAITFAKYTIKPFFLLCDTPEVPELLLAAVCILLLTAVNCLSVKLTMKIQDIFTAAKLAALGIIILTGLVYLILWSYSEEGVKLLEANTFNANHKHEFEKPFSFTDLSLSFYNGLFAYAGWNYLNMVTQELKDPYTNLPRAIWIGLPLVTIVYVLANAAYFIVLNPVEILTPPVAVAFGGRTYSIHLQWLIPLFVAMSTFGGVNGTLFTTARLFFAGAEEGQMPNILACVHLKRCTPVPALLFSCLATLIVMCVGDIRSLITYVSFVLWVSTGVSVAALIWLRHTQPNLNRPIRVNLIFPILYVVLTAFLVGCSIVSDPQSTGIGTLITLTGVPVYLIFIWWPKKNAEKQRKAESSSSFCLPVTSFLQKIMNVVPQEKSETLL